MSLLFLAEALPGLRSRVYHSAEQKSPLPAIRCSGVHLQDITRLNDGKADTKDGLINWTKMRQIAGRCAVVERPYPIDPHFANDIGASRLITKQPVYNLDDDDVSETPSSLLCSLA